MDIHNIIESSSSTTTSDNRTTTTTTAATTTRILKDEKILSISSIFDRYCKRGNRRIIFVGCCIVPLLVYQFVSFHGNGFTSYTVTTNTNFDIVTTTTNQSNIIITQNNPQQQQQQQQQSFQERTKEENIIMLTKNNETTQQYKQQKQEQPQQQQEDIQKTQQENNNTNNNNNTKSLQQSTTTTTSTTTSSTTTTKQPLNILILYPDDWRYDTIGGMKPIVYTPFLNSLMKEGIHFKHNCVTTSICWISRATYFTGQYVSRHQSYELKTPKFHYDTFINKRLSWPTILQDYYGYYTGHIGKWQYKNINNNQIQTFFNYTNIYDGKHWYYNTIIDNKNKSNNNNNDNNNKTNFFTREKTNEKEKEERIVIHATDKTKNDAIEFLQKRPKDKPFALTVAFFPPKALKKVKSYTEPGAPWNPKKETEETLFVENNNITTTTTTTTTNNATTTTNTNNTISSSASSSSSSSSKYYIPMPPDTYHKLPYFFKKHEKVGRERYKQRFINTTKTKTKTSSTNNTTTNNNTQEDKDKNDDDYYTKAILQYYRLIYDVDQACKDIIETLKEQNIYNNTLIIFTTDNGYSLGEHGLAGKWYPYEESIRVPLIIKDPRMPISKHNTIDTSFTLNIDLAPTIIGAAASASASASASTSDESSSSSSTSTSSSSKVIPSTMQGRNIADLYLPNRINKQKQYNFTNPKASLLQNYKLPWREEFYYEWPIDNGERSPTASALVRKDYKYIYWSQFKYEQLFHLISDPYEENDLLHPITNSTNSTTSNASTTTTTTSNNSSSSQEQENHLYESILLEMRQRHNELAILVK